MVVEDGIRWALAQMQNVTLLRGQMRVALEGVDVAATQATPQEQLQTIQQTLQILRTLRLQPVPPRLLMPPASSSAEPGEV